MNAELIRYEAARRRLLRFTKHTFPGYRVNFHHELICKALEAVARYEIPRLIIVAPPRQGKALAVGTPVLTPSRGFVPVESLRPGDKVLSASGKPCNVVARSPIWKDRRVFEVTTNDGEQLVVDENHDWLVQTGRKADRWKVRETKTLVRKGKDSNRAWPVPMQGSAVLRRRRLQIDPWALGFWLGDGSSYHATIHVGEQDFSFVRRRFEDAGYPTSNRSTPETFGVLGGFHAKLKTQGLYQNKHIPDAYLYAHESARRELLRGLIDSDGYVSPEGQVEFCSTTLALAEGVQFLVRSLGARASLNVGRATLYGKDCGPKYRVMFYLDGAASLPRKAQNTRNQTKRPHRYIRVQELPERRDTVCIEVDSDDHLFLAGHGLVPTHNSELVSRRFPAWYLGNNPHRQIITATYGQDLSDRMSRDVKRIRESQSYKELFGDQPYGEMNKVSEWSLGAGGVYKAVGVGGPVTGFGANILLIDDPTKNREEAESETIREKTWEWFNNDVMTRLEAPNAVVLMATRWHEDDLIGRVLASPTADQWVVLHLDRIRDEEDANPADTRAHGAPLWPGRLMLPWEKCPELDNWPGNSPEVMAELEALNSGFELSDDDEVAIKSEIPTAKPFNPDEYDGNTALFVDGNLPPDERTPVSLLELVQRDLAHFESFQKNDPYGASALERGNPSPRGGTLVDPEAINRYLGTTEGRAHFCGSNLVISVDANFKKTKTSDRAAITVFGRTHRPNALYWIDEYAGRWTYPQFKRRVKAIAALYPRAAILIEAKANGQALIDELREEGYARVVDYDPKGDSKESRAQVAAEFIAGGGFFVPVPQNAPKIVEWLEEVTKYGTTKYDDRMDTLSQVVIRYCGHKTGLTHLRRIVSITDSATG
jgi:predicted phage terminase large subunit-like protein